MACAPDCKSSQDANEFYRGPRGVLRLLQKLLLLMTLLMLLLLLNLTLLLPFLPGG